VTPLAPAIVPLLARGRVHPWLHVDGAGVVVGRVTDAGEVQIITSDRQVLDPAVVEKTLAFKPRACPHLAARWRGPDAEAWLTGGAPAASFSEVLALLIHELRAAVEFPREEHASLLAAWGLGTYFSHHVLTFPRLALTGERGSGKSKVLSILSAVAFNASLCLTPTPAVLFRLIDETRGALLLDEIESLDTEDNREVLAIINSGYKRGAMVPRVEGDRTRRVEFFSVYAPLAVAGIRGLHATTEDRCIPLVMQRGADPARVNAELDPDASAFARIRDGCYRLLLERGDAVRAARDTLTLPGWLHARARELWRPLLALAHIADAEPDGLGLDSDLLALARDHIEDRDDSSVEADALLTDLADRLGEAPTTTVRPGELSEPLRARLGWRDAPTPEAVSRLLRRLGFRPERRDRAGRRYVITAEQVRAVQARFTPPSTVTPTPSSRNYAP
jgi:hypothetical protein